MRLTEEREKEIRENDTRCGVYNTNAVRELLAEIDRLRAEIKSDPYVSKANYLEVIRERDQLKAEAQERNKWIRNQASLFQELKLKLSRYADNLTAISGPNGDEGEWIRGLLKDL